MTIARSLDAHSWTIEVEFDFRDSGIRDDDIKVLSGLHKLTKVDLSETAITPSGAAELLTLYPKVEVVIDNMSSKPAK